VFVKLYDWLIGRQQSYQHTLRAPSAHLMMRDLARFCRANQSCFDPDPRIHAAMEGRREVWNRIQEHLQLSHEELWRLYNPGQPPTIEGNE
jgi:hypothetical protein